MTKVYALVTTKTIEEGALEPDQTLFRIITDDDGLILQMPGSRFRESDVRVIEIRQGWTDLAQTTLDEFRAFVDVYGGSSLMVVELGEEA